MTRQQALQVAKPILFNTDMVRAILNGRKTVTRRVIKFDKEDLSECRFVEMSIDPAETRIAKDGTEYPHDLKGLYATFEDDNSFFPLVKAPYQIGDILYVRETWAYQYCWECEQQNIEDECDFEKHRFKSAPFGEYGCYKFPTEHDEPVDHQWHPSIHMPKEAARIFLRVTDVRVERLQDITIQGLQDEGILLQGYISQYAALTTDVFEPFKELWNSTVKKSDLEKYGWEANPWVWVIEFERVGATK
ncbi:MAG: hypothetical protein NC299_13340 [Lachnospiraceae bacterium]|nr:hypothetical protein [Ruminococcus sp.]MCM1276320.1 hypothetical protein [Lachnospiraceae bacterium]